MDLNSIFDGIGTQILCLVLTLLLGGVGGYFVGVFRTVNQKQRAGNGAKQIQRSSIGLDDESNRNKKSKKISESVIIQKQTAGDNANQSQVGNMKNE